MENYYGHKAILARPMNRKEYNDYRGWKLPKDENGDDKGYLVEYIDGGQSNHPKHDGYISWSPKEVFEKAYKANKNLTFSEALYLLKQGFPVKREGWNKGKFAFRQVPASINVETIVPKMQSLPARVKSIFIKRNEIKGAPIQTLEYSNQIALVDKDNNIYSYLPSSEDLFAEDWGVR